MKTVSTKVNESVYQKLTESCGKSGTCISEKLRKLVEGSLESNPQESIQKSPERQVIKLSDCPIIPELTHSIKTTCGYVIVNGQYFKKCDPLPKATIKFDS